MDAPCAATKSVVSCLLRLAREGMVRRGSSMQRYRGALSPRQDKRSGAGPGLDQRTEGRPWKPPRPREPAARMTARRESLLNAGPSRAPKPPEGKASAILALEAADIRRTTRLAAGLAPFRAVAGPYLTERADGVRRSPSVHPGKVCSPAGLWETLDPTWGTSHLRLVAVTHPRVRRFHTFRS